MTVQVKALFAVIKGDRLVRKYAGEEMRSGTKNVVVMNVI